MLLMAIGMFLFFGAHLVPLVPLKNSLLNNLGEKKYKGLIALPSLAGLVLIIIGYRQADLDPLWYPVSHGREIALLLMPVAFVLLAAANMKTNIKRYIKHPMLTGILIWAGVHLINNGELRAVILFSAFAVYAVVDMLFTTKRPVDMPSYPVKKDVVVMVAGLFAYAVALHIHHAWAGIRLF